ncbi:MAG: hypothetical protein VZQ49_00210 [Methanobrevibacter sp.]|nr:hypothetical protein [Methanobrevibacter sp.]
MITINDWMQIKPKRVRFIELDVCNNSRVENEIVRDETTEQECVEIINKYAERNFYMIEILNIENELYYHVYFKDNGTVKYS